MVPAFLDSGSSASQQATLPTPMPCRPIPGCLSHALPRSYLLEQCSPCLHSLIGSMSLNAWLMGYWSYLLPKSAHLPPCLLLLTAVKEGIASNPFLSVALSIDATVLRRAMAALRKVWTSSPRALSCGTLLLSIILSSSHLSIHSSDQAPIAPHPAVGRIWSAFHPVATALDRSIFSSHLHIYQKLLQVQLPWMCGCLCIAGGEGLLHGDPIPSFQCGFTGVSN